MNLCPGFLVANPFCILYSYWSNIPEFCLLPGPGRWNSAQRWLHWATTSWPTGYLLQVSQARLVLLYTVYSVHCSKKSLWEGFIYWQCLRVTQLIVSSQLILLPPNNFWIVHVFTGPLHFFASGVFIGGPPFLHSLYFTVFFTSTSTSHLNGHPSKC